MFSKCIDCFLGWLGSSFQSDEFIEFFFKFFNVKICAQIEKFSLFEVLKNSWVKFDIVNLDFILCFGKLSEIILVNPCVNGRVDVKRRDAEKLYLFIFPLFQPECR